MGAGCGAVYGSVHAADCVGGLVHVLGGRFNCLNLRNINQIMNQTYCCDDRSSQVHSIYGKSM